MFRTSQRPEFSQIANLNKTQSTANLKQKKNFILQNKLAIAKKSAKRPMQGNQPRRRSNSAQAKIYRPSKEKM
jgi:hypothetical protein